MSSESYFNSDFNESVENHVAGKNLKKAKAHRKKRGRNLKICKEEQLRKKRRI
jgi:hypothetical protein